MENEEIIEISDVISNDKEIEQTEIEEDISGDALNMTDSHSERSEESESEENLEPLDIEDEEPVIEEAPAIPEPDGFVYFDDNKQAYAQPIEEYICRIPIEQWQEFCTLSLGNDYDIIDGEFTDLRLTDTYIVKKLTIAKNNKLAENITKAKRAVENGYVTYKNAQFETNSQTVGDLTATMLMLQAQQNPEITYTWLSKDDKAVELTLEDFITLGNLIAEFKNTIWSNKYLQFKIAIETAKTLAELNEITINYEVDFEIV